MVLNSLSCFSGSPEWNRTALMLYLHILLGFFFLIFKFLLKRINHIIYFNWGLFKTIGHIKQNSIRNYTKRKEGKTFKQPFVIKFFS